MGMIGFDMEMIWEHDMDFIWFSMYKLWEWYGCNNYHPRADGAKRRARVLIPPGYLHPGKGKH
jgi:hypothetical protein